MGEIQFKLPVPLGVVCYKEVEKLTQNYRVFCKLLLKLVLTYAEVPISIMNLWICVALS